MKRRPLEAIRAEAMKLREVIARKRKRHERTTSEEVRLRVVIREQLAAEIRARNAAAKGAAA